MKKLLILSIFCLSIINIAKAQYVDIPDSNFRKFLIKTVPACFNKVGQMDTTCSGVLNQIFLNCHDASIQDVTGLQYFKNVTSIELAGNKITSFPLLPNKLTFLGCGGNLLKTLPSLPVNLKSLNCYSNQLINLPTLPHGLTSLSCDYNQLTTLPTLPLGLTSLSCDNNQLITLPSLPASLTSFYCKNNLLISLPLLPDSISLLNCSNNMLTTLSTLPSQLIYLACYKNKLSALPILPNTVITLDFSGNLFTSLPSLPNSIQDLNCSYNLFNCIPKLPTSLQTLNILGTGIQCLPIGTNATITPSGLPFCNNPCTVTSNYSNYVNIPDSMFRRYLEITYPAAMNKYGQMDTAYTEILNATSLTAQGVNSFPNTYIKDLTGIQYFKNLKHLSVIENSITTLPKLPDSLVFFNCINNKLTSLPTLPMNLDTLLCEQNQLTSLPTLPKTLIELDCNFNQLTTLPVLPKSIVTLTCGSNHLTSLPILPDSLQLLQCPNNPLTYIPRLPKLIIEFDCFNNKLITSLPNLDSLNNLLLLNCRDDSNLNCLPKLPNSLIGLNLAGTGIQCLPNYINSTVSISPAGLPLCNPTNNANQCKAFPTVMGKVFGDDNSNGIKDSNEYYIPFVPVKLNTGEIAYTNDEGQYAISPSDTGSFSLSVTAPPNYKVLPTNTNFTFSATNSLLTLSDIALQPTAFVDSLAMTIEPWNAAVSGRSIAFSVDYRNLGTITTVATISFTYDTSKLLFDTASVPLVSHIGNVLTWQDTLTPNYFGGRFYHFGYSYPYFTFTVKPSVNMGDSIKSMAFISSAKTSATNNNTLIARSSYDPNSKDATPQLTTQQILDGEMIDYHIHFQNVGNASAKSVVIADTISPLLTQGLLQMMGSSHNPNITFKNNIIYFEFLKINLPDSGTNQLKSNGFVHFKLKPLTTLSEGTNITNTASIYFDYNSPVVTNTASTLIKNIALPVSILTYMAQEVLGSNGQIANNWTCANELNVAYYNVQRSVDATNFSNIGRVSAKGNGSYSFLDLNAGNYAKYKTIYYRLQIVDRDGSVRYSKTMSVQLSVISNQLTVFPNPSKNFIIISGKGVKEIRLIDNLGREVLNRKV